MRNIVIIIVVIATACHSRTTISKPNEVYQNNWKKYNLKGRVRSVIEFNYMQYIPDAELMPHVTKQYFQFDTTGNCTELTNFLEHNEVFGHRCVYLYDNAGNYIDAAYYRQDSSLDFRTTHQFDEEGYLVQRIEYKGHSLVQLKEERTYGANRSFMKISNVLPPNIPTCTYRYTYDAAGRRTSEDLYDHEEDSLPERTTVWKYSGDSTEEINYRNGAVDFTRLTVHDKNKRLLLHTIHSMPAHFTDYDGYYTYDTSGNIIEYMQTNSEGTDTVRSYRYIYEYDKKGNWIKRTTYGVSGAVKSSIERRIGYY